MSGTTWSKFFWADWETDPALRLCSLAAQGLWMRMLCIAASHDPTGYVCVAGRSLGVTDLAILTGASETQVGVLFAELDRNGVFSRDRTGRIYSRRMVRDSKVAAMNRKNGKLGGNPNLRKDTGNQQPVNPPVKPRHKPHKPLASRRVGASSEAPNPSRRAPTLSLVESEAPRSPEPEQSPAERAEIRDGLASLAKTITRGW